MVTAGQHEERIRYMSTVEVTHYVSSLDELAKLFDEWAVRETEQIPYCKTKRAADAHRERTMVYEHVADYPRSTVIRPKPEKQK